MSEVLTPMALALCKMLAITCTTPEALYAAASDQPSASPAHYDSMLMCPSDIANYCQEMIGDDDCVTVAVRRDERRGWTNVVSLCRAKNHEGDEIGPES